jgi:hypothetical protein
MDCSVYSLADADVDLKRLLRIAEARRQLNDALIHQSSPMGMVRAIGSILESTGQASACERSVELPIDGWTTWCADDVHPQRREAHAGWHHICLLGQPTMVLAIRGHDAGDRVPKQVARVLRESVREQDQTFRLGVEEFLVLLPEADQATALMVTERIRLSIHQLDLVGEAPGGRLTVSLGVSIKSAQLSCDFSHQMELADQALYAAKGDGRDRVRAADVLSLSSH